MGGGMSLIHCTKKHTGNVAHDPRWPWTQRDSNSVCWTIITSLAIGTWLTKSSYNLQYYFLIMFNICSLLFKTPDKIQKKKENRHFYFFLTAMPLATWHRDFHAPCRITLYININIPVGIVCWCDKCHDQKWLGKQRFYFILWFQVLVHHWQKEGQGGAQVETEAEAMRDADSWFTHGLLLDSFCIQPRTTCWMDSSAFSGSNSQSLNSSIDDQDSSLQI